jgi:hypothetical protein
MTLFVRARMKITKRVKRATIAAATTIVTVCAILVGASPAQAATPWFEIFYSPNCGAGKSASKVYLGANSGERWINDKFDNKNFGSAGYNQNISHNAASVYVRYGWFTINYDSNQAWQLPYTTGACFNLPSWVRNYNRNWTMFAS